MKPTKRMVAAMLALLDQATEIASLAGPDGDILTQFLTRELALLWRLNDEWQKAQLAAPPYRKPKLRKKR